MRRRSLGLIFAALLHASLGMFVRAQLPQATLSWVFPPGAKAGLTSEVTVSGTDLDDPRSLRFSDPRITATLRPGKPNQFDVSVPSNVPPSVVDVRWAGRFGVSNPRAFAIGQREEFTASGTNTAAGSAIDVPLETTVNSRALPNGYVWFRFQASVGLRVIIQVDARDLDSRLTPNITVTDTNGRELAVARRREWLDFTAPEDGRYLIKLSDQTFRGGDDYHFRLTVTTGPRLEFALPNVLRAGETNQVTLFGRNLPGGQPSPFLSGDGQPLEQLSVEILAPEGLTESRDWAARFRKAASATLLDTVFPWQLASSNRLSNPLAFALTTNLVVTAPPNSTVEVTPPCEFAAAFPKRGEISGLTFQASKGEVFWLEFFADRLGFPSDPHGVVQRASTNDQGKLVFNDVLELGDIDGNFGDREFNTTTRDAAARFEAPESGTYRVLVRDLFNLADGRPNYAYRLSVRRPTPDFRLVCIPMPPPRTGEDRRVQLLPVTLRREQTTALKVLAFRADGFDGEIELFGTNLAPGLSLSSSRIAAKENAVTILLTASENAVPLTNMAILGRATIGSNSIIRTSAFASVLWPVADFNNENAAVRFHRDEIVSVVNVESAPVSIVAPPSIQVVAEGKLTVPLTILRRGEFQGAFNLKPAGHTTVEKAKEIAIPEKATNFTAEINLAEVKLPPGAHTLWLQGTIAGKYRNNPEAVALAQADLDAAEKALASVTDNEKPKALERKEIALAAKKAAEEKAKPRDVTILTYSQPFVVHVTAKPEEKK